MCEGSDLTSATLSLATAKELVLVMVIVDKSALLLAGVEQVAACDGEGSPAIWCRGVTAAAPPSAHYTHGTRQPPIITISFTTQHSQPRQQNNNSWQQQQIGE